MEYERYELVPPGQAKGVYSSIIDSDATVKKKVIEMLQEVGRNFGGDAVLVGNIYRWRERDGTNWGVKSPASVAFDLHLLRSRDGSILWSAKFDKTQKGLTENLFDLDTFLASKGRWMTADTLAGVGLKKMLGQIKKEEPALEPTEPTAQGEQ